MHDELQILHDYVLGQHVHQVDWHQASEIALASARADLMQTAGWSDLALSAAPEHTAQHTAGYLAQSACWAVIESVELFYRLTNTRLIRERILRTS